MSEKAASESERQQAKANWLSVAAVALRFGVHRSQVFAWVDGGQLRAWDAKDPDAKRRNLRFKPEWVDAFEKRRTVNANAA